MTPEQAADVQANAAIAQVFLGVIIGCATIYSLARQISC
jgi:hypothetical protein